MRRALASAAALLVVACQVDVEGAICHVPGATAECPAGQACGNDRRCSERALACETAGTRCEPGSAVCAGTDGKARVERCSGEVDPACGAWGVEDCAASGLECGTRGLAAACECPAYADANLWADPVGGSVAGAAPFPTGARTPAVCRFRGLGDALAAAKVVADAGGAPVVQAHGEVGIPLVFGDVATGEAFPLTVAAGVALFGAAAPAGPTIVRAEGTTAASLVRIEGAIDGGAGGVRIESLGAAGTGVRVSCGGTSGRPRIANVIVDGGGALTKGIDVEGRACGAELTGVDVSKVSGPALEVAADPGVEVTVTASVFRESTIGIRATGGKLTVGSELPSDAVTVSGNMGEGILLTGGATSPFATLDVQLLGATVEQNRGTGVVLDSVSTASKLAVRGCTVYANGAASPRKYGPGDSQRSAGGVLVSQISLAPLVFEANRVSSNAGDQLAFESSGPWSISTGACDLANLFACVGEGAYAVGVAGGGTVDASYTVWPIIPLAGFAGPGVSPTMPYCNGAGGAPAPPAPCPAP
jgi:hypothetical protein